MFMFFCPQVYMEKSGFGYPAPKTITIGRNLNARLTL